MAASDATATTNGGGTPNSKQNSENDESTAADPLPLAELKSWVSAESYECIRRDDEEKEALQRQCEEENAPLNLFATDDDSDDACEERVQSWTSSPTQSDGVGGFYDRDEVTVAEKQQLQQEDGVGCQDTVSVLFILSDSFDGFGDTLWSSARHVANLMADSALCREALGWKEEGSLTGRHPLFDKSFVELGAGGGVPSWTAMRRGARVVSTDLASPNRIRCMAECLERNFRAMMKQENDQLLLQQAALSRAAPCPWGGSVEDVLLLNGGARFDVLVAADCCYMPWCHNEMLDTIDKLLDKDRGVALVPFALHGNTDDENVWGILGRAREKGFTVVQLPTRQLTPPGRGMEDKQGLVHTIRLTRK